MTTSDPWDPAQYDRFRDERRQPFFDLLALVQARPAMRVVDLGCGTGELTRALHRHVGARETVGIDSSAAMLARSAAFTDEGLSFVHGDLCAFHDDAPRDLIFSNAALQWVPDHEGLFARLRGLLGPGGQLAVQVPANHDHASHATAAALLEEEPFRSAVQGPTRHWDPRIEGYAALLHRLGFREQHVRMQVYGHLLERRDDVVEWVKGTLLTEVQSRLPAALFPAFFEAYRARLLPQLADTKPYFYPFKRMLLWAAL